MPTYTGKLLRINLSNTSYTDEDISVQNYKKFISARGLGAKYLYDELGANTDPLSPENKLLMLIGVLGGTGLQGFSKWVVMSKSPLTGTIMRSYTGGNFGVWMKFAGYDLIITVTSDALILAHPGSASIESTRNQSRHHQPIPIQWTCGH